MNWIIEPEYIACILLAILIGYSFLWNRSKTSLDTLFRACLLISLGSIISNIIGIFAIDNAVWVPLTLNILLNSFYFASSSLMLAAISAYTLLLLFEGHYDDKRLYAGLFMVSIVFVAQLSLVCLNLKTGCLFRFDESFRYIRGMFNRSPYVALLVDSLVCLACYALVCKKVRRAYRGVFITVPLLSAGLATVQFISPNTMVTGTIAALVLVVLFIYGQQERAHIDHLTELSSREIFYSTLEKYARRGRLFHVVIICLRGFKEINSHYGQRAGDAVLRCVGRYIESLNENDVACRFSGVEFALILTNISDYEYEALFNRLCARFQQPWQVEDETMQLHAAIADISYPDCAPDCNTMIASLEYAVRLAKQSGKPVRFDKQLRREFGRRSYIISLLEPAFGTDRYTIAFQPIINTRTEMPEGAEVLLRLTDPMGQTIMPGEFVPLVEERGLTARLDELVLKKAVAFFGKNRDCGVNWFSVNVAGHHYKNAYVTEEIVGLLREHQLPASMLKLEITEQMLIADMEAARKIISKLKSCGVGVCLDDFGTGYSNLAMAMSLPLEYIKIDKSLVQQVIQDPSANHMLNTMLRGFSAIGLETVAEGVETEEQRRIIGEMGFQKIQGFYYAKPLSEEDFLAYMKKAKQSRE